tara:strand:+ start:380 stop:1810 length:1431 start_codon:yes stop_codon:yes gene_type:complete
MPTDEEVLLNAGQDDSFGFGTLEKGVTGTSLLGSSIYMMRNQTPGGIRRMTADYARNFLPSFYSQNFLTKIHPKANQAVQYTKELGATAYRIGRDTAYNVTNSEFYNKTGISPTLIRNIEEVDLTKGTVIQALQDKTITKNDAIREVKNAQKRMLFKASSDKANQLIFFGKASKELDNLVGDMVTETDTKGFIKSVGHSKRGSINKRIGNYVLNQQPPIRNRKLANLDITNPDNLKFIKYKNVQYGDVLRGAQFDRNAYNAMLQLKNSKGKGNLINLASSLKNVNNATVIGNNVLFSISPAIKSQYDWGGYNAVGIWNKSRPDKIRFIATDVPDTPLPGTGGKVPGIKFVDSKEITISDKAVAKEMNSNSLRKTNPAEYEKRRLAALKGWETRRANLKGQQLNLFGDTYNNIQEVKGTKGIEKHRLEGFKNLANKRKNFAVSTATKLSKLGRRLPGALGILMNAWAITDVYNSMKE